MENIKPFSSDIRLPLLAWSLLLVLLIYPITEGVHHLTTKHSNINTNLISNDLELHSSTLDCILCDFIVNRKITYLLSDLIIIENIPKNRISYTSNLVDAVYTFRLLLFPLANSPPL